MNTKKVLDCPTAIRDAIDKYFTYIQNKVDENLNSKNPGNWSDLGYPLTPFLRRLAEDSLALEEIRDFGIKPELFRISHDISPEMHLKMQAAWQENTTNAVSKTINAPNDITVDEIKEIYTLAWKLKCKGVTIYRSGTRAFEVLTPIEKNIGTMFSNTINTAEEERLKTHWSVEEEKKPEVGNNKRPHSVFGVTDSWNTGHGRLLVTANWNGTPHEIIANVGKAGGCDTAFLETIARLISLALQKGIDYEDIAYQINGITCCPAWDEGKLILSPSDAIAKTMRNHFTKLYEKREEISIDMPILKTQTSTNDKCRACNGHMISLSGCPTCESCGLGKCD